ncbi:hypothetical protein VTK73DRAFT_1367 [Phialemonium thermophilum]|uniref:FAR1 domain-containing protein n=1 Tax=Phialemonium thermophilum TaxID=223376 RepID=A0ABR3X9Z2_9PEZI
MTDLQSPSSIQLNAILKALASIDQRLIRIEAALQLRNDDPGQYVPVAPSTKTPPVPNVSPTTSSPGAPPPQTPSALVDGESTVFMPNRSPGFGTVGFGGAFTPLEGPPAGYTVSSRTTMQDELDQWTLPRGYSMRVAGAKVAGKRKVRWACYRGGQARHRRAPVDEAVLRQAKAEGRRKPTTDRGSKKCGCPFRFEMVEASQGAGVWVLHYPNERNGTHNHGPSNQDEDPRARKLPQYMAVEVDRWLVEGWQVGRIQEELRARGFTNVLKTDLYNRRRVLGKQSTQAD